MRLLKEFTLFEKNLILANILVSMILMLVARDYSAITLIGFISAITNTICVVLVAKRHISNFVWGIVATATYAIVAFYHGHTAEWIFFAGYYLPMNFVGWFFWARNKSVTSENTVDSKSMSLKTSVLVYSAAIVVTVLVAWIISFPSLNMFLYHQVFDFGFDKYLVDSASSIFAIIAMVLLTKRYREQWVLWMVLNVMSLVLWGIYTFDPLMILQWSCLLVNSIYGYIKWGGKNA